MTHIERRPLPERVDVAILGAGFTGLSAARTLAKGGARVAVLESHTLGWGASSRNGGMVLTGLKLGVTDLLSRYGKAATQRMFTASLEAISTVEQIVADEKIDCDFSRCGHLEVANKPGHFDAFQRSAETMEQELGHSVRIVPRENLFAEIGSNCIVFPPCDRREKSFDVVRKKHSIRAAEQKRRSPIPPAAEKSPEIAVARAHPAIKAALYGHCGREFCRDQRNRNAPEERNEQVIEQRHARAGGCDHFFEAKRTARRVGEHDEHKGENSRLFRGGFQRGGVVGHRKRKFSGRMVRALTRTRNAI